VFYGKREQGLSYVLSAVMAAVSTIESNNRSLVTVMHLIRLYFSQPIFSYTIWLSFTNTVENLIKYKGILRAKQRMQIKSDRLITDFPNEKLLIQKTVRTDIDYQ